MSKLETNTIDTVSGTTNLTIGSTNTSTITMPSGEVTGHCFPSFRVQPSATQNVPNQTWTKLNFNTEIWDTDSAYDTSTYRFTVPSGKAGKYFTQYSVGVRDSATINVVDIAWYLNGAQDRTFRRYHQASSTSNQYQTQVQTMTINLSVGDYLELYMWQNAGGNLEVNNQNANLDSYWSLFRIGA
jgi:hypothetical protein